MSDIPLKEYVDTRFRDLEKRMDERFETQTTHLNEARKVIDARLHEMNALRLQIEGERKTYVTKGEWTLVSIVSAGWLLLLALLAAAIKLWSK